MVLIPKPLLFHAAVGVITHGQIQKSYKLFFYIYLMNKTYPLHWPQFYTATIYEWYPMLTKDKYKNIIISSLQFLVNDKRIILNAYVIMNNHIHLIWQALPEHTPSQIQLSFMRYTAQQIKFELQKDDVELLEKCKVDKTDRAYQIWKREALSIALFTPLVFNQKLDYIHQNPVKAGLCDFAEDYYYSSASFYQTGIDKFKMLTHYMG